MKPCLFSAVEEPHTDKILKYIINYKVTVVCAGLDMLYFQIFFFFVFIFVYIKAAMDNVDPIFHRTALHLACLYNQKDIVKLLVENNADKLATDIFGYLPYNFCQSKEVLQTLNQVRYWISTLKLRVFERNFPYFGIFNGCNLFNFSIHGIICI